MHETSEANYADTILKALNEIGAPRDKLSVAQQCLANALFKHSIRLPGVGERTTPAEVHNALSSITQGLRQIEEGLSTIAFARKTAEAGSRERAAHLADIHRIVVGAIADAMPTSFGITPAQIVDSVPEYSRLGCKDEWATSFAIAAQRVERGSGAWSNADLALPKSPTQVERDELIADLARIVWELTGKKPKAPDRAGNLPQNWQSKFQSFVTKLWRLTGDQDAPSAKVIRSVLKNLTLLAPDQKG